MLHSKPAIAVNEVDKWLIPCDYLIVLMATIEQKSRIIKYSKSTWQLKLKYIICLEEICRNPVAANEGSLIQHIVLGIEIIMALPRYLQHV